VAIDLTIHGTGEGICSLSGKTGEGFTVTFRDGTLTEGFLSHKAFFALVKMKFAQAAKPTGKPAQVVPITAPTK
jgi:hypothetical protein